MIPLKEDFTVPAPPDRVWPLLADPAQVAACLPGAAITADKGGGVYEGTMRVKFGPTVVNFRGEITLVYDHVGRSCTITGRGIDQRGAARALANGTVMVAGDSASTVTIDGEYHITGPLETFAKTGGVHVARALMAEFSQNIARILSTATGPAGASESPSASTQPAHPPVAHELRAGAILWRSFIGWIRSLLGPKGTGRSQ